MMSMKELMLLAPEGQIDRSLLPLFKLWDEPNPTALQILHPLDLAIYTGGASGFVVSTLQMLYSDALKAEKTTHEEVLKHVTWRGGDIKGKAIEVPEDKLSSEIPASIKTEMEQLKLEKDRRLSILEAARAVGDGTTAEEAAKALDDAAVMNENLRKYGTIDAPKDL